MVVGDKNGIRVPTPSTERVGRARFRGVRFVHTHLNGELLSKEDLTDLALLQLDLVACITERRDEGLVIHVGYLIPQNKKGQAWDFIGPVPIQEFDLDFIEFITELENEFVKERGRYYVLDKDRERCILVSVTSPRWKQDVADHIVEMKDLCYSAGITVVETIIQRPKEVHPKFLIGKGKIEEIVVRCQQLGVDLLVFDDELSPGQIKNISSMTDLRVIDRNQLILDIFAGRARTNEAKIQVELAQLRYIRPRLAEANIAFSRLTGGIGARGPGETKLEVDRRRIRDKISFLEKKLNEVRLARTKRERNEGTQGSPLSQLLDILIQASLP